MIESFDSNSLPVYFLIDEFANIGKIPNFPSLITTLRKRRCSCSLVIQDLEQLNLVYGAAGASTILNGGCAGKLFFPGLGLSTCEQIERLLGKSTTSYVEEGSYNKGDDPSTAKDVTVGRSLFTADEIRRLDDHKAIFVFSNKRPALLNMSPYYKQSSLLKKTRIPFSKINSSFKEYPPQLPL